MAVRTAHNKLRQRAQQSGTSMRALIVRAIEKSHSEPRKGRHVTGPLVKRKGKLGLRFPTDENPHALIFS
jgi:hypothetical protein